MGQCYYYLRAVFPTKEDAEEALLLAKMVLKQHSELLEMLHNIRFSEKPLKEKHQKLVDSFPLVVEFIGLPEPKEDDNVMTYLVMDLDDFNWNDCDIYLKGNEIHIQSYVWHLTTWDRIAEFFTKLGAKVGWTKDGIGILKIEDIPLEYPPKKLDEKKLRKLKIMAYAESLKKRLLEAFSKLHYPTISLNFSVYSLTFLAFSYVSITKSGSGEQ